MKLTFKQYLQEAAPIFRYVYHVTTTDNLANIKRRGLLPVQQSPGKYWQHIKYDRPSIFVITRNSTDAVNEVLAMMVGKEFSSDELDNDEADIDGLFERLVILTIDLSKCRNIDLEPDPRAGHWVHSKILYGEVPPNAITDVKPVPFN